jgi:outer membrane protein assembly factor BamB
VYLWPLLLPLTLPAAGEDWPNWRGPFHDGIARAAGLRQAWPAEGPPVLWQADLTGGYSSLAVARGRLFTQSKDGGEEIILAFDAATGRKLWEYRYSCDYGRHPTLDKRFISGPRATPAVDGGRVYAIGTTGRLHCLDVGTGKLVWGRDLLKLAGRDCPDEGYCASPLIVGDRLFVHPGGPAGRSVAALDKRSGDVLWTALDDPIGYATPVPITFRGRPQVVYFTGLGVVGVSPERGQALWRYEWRTHADINAATPVYAAGRLFLSSNYGKGCALIRLTEEGGPQELWKSLVMQNHFASSVLYQGHLYGFSTDQLRCVEFATGNLRWVRRGLGKGSLLIAGGHLVVLGESGELVLAEATPARYTEKARWQAFDGRCWSAPALARGKLFVRNETRLRALDLRDPGRGKGPPQ